MSDWLQAHPLTVVGLVLWGAGLLWLMPGRDDSPARSKTLGILNAAIGLVLWCVSLGGSRSELGDEIMFWVFGVGALLSGVLMISARNPVYAALWFALATLSTCGLFLLQSAPFLAAATVIVYAGAVIVTFLFVIMLAQQSGAASYDRRAVQPVTMTLLAFVLLGAIAYTIQSQPVVAIDNSGVATGIVSGNPLSQVDEKHPVGNLQGLGRSLFGDYLFAVELAGTLLLVACIGAIAIAPRREQGAL